MRSYIPKSEYDKALKTVQTYHIITYIENNFNNKSVIYIVINKNLFKVELEEIQRYMSISFMYELVDFVNQFNIQVPIGIRNYLTEVDGTQTISSQTQDIVTSYKYIDYETYNRFEQIIIYFWVFKYKLKIHPSVKQ